MERFKATGSRNSVDTQRGFTIIELMITFLILGILVSMVVMTMQVSKSKAQQAACKGNLKIVSEAIILYAADHDGADPPDLDTLVTNNPPYIKSSFKWLCPAGNYGAQSGDYRDYYSTATGQTSCPRLNHNP